MGEPEHKRSRYLYKMSSYLFKNVFNGPVLGLNTHKSHGNRILSACMVMSGVSALSVTVKINIIDLV